MYKSNQDAFKKLKSDHSILIENEALCEEQSEIEAAIREIKTSQLYK